MKLAKAPCPVAGCKYVAEHVKENYAKAMLGRHKSKEHGIVSPGAKYYKKNQPRNSEVAAPMGGESRPYTRKPKAAVVVNFCPCCGTSLRAVAVAVNMGGGK